MNVNSPLKNDTSAALQKAFLEAHTHTHFLAKPVTDALLAELFELVKWAPTSQNSQPARYVVLNSSEGKARLIPALSPGNVDKVHNAPATIIVAWDTEFYNKLPVLFPAYDARTAFTANAELAYTTALRNSSMQGAYLILAARLLGLDCGPMSGFNNAKVDAEFFPDGKWKSNFLLNIGYGDASLIRPRGPRLEINETVRTI